MFVHTTLTIQIWYINTDATNHKISINTDTCDEGNIYHEGIKVYPKFYNKIQPLLNVMEILKLKYKFFLFNLDVDYQIWH